MKKRRSLQNVFLVLGPLILVALSIFGGRYPLSVSEVLAVFGSKLGLVDGVDPVHLSVVWDIRLPRAILAVMVGASLAASGAAFQGMFRNPLVSSGILGVSNGAGFGAALAIVYFQGQYFYTYLLAFIFAILAVFLSYLIGHSYKSTPTIMLVLGGTVVSSVFSSLISLLKYVADPYDQLPSIVFWLMGSLSTARFKDVAMGAIPILIGLTGLLVMRWRLNVLSMDDQEAQALGVNLYVTKGMAILFSSLATAGAVSVSGVIGWVGLVIPHIGRMLVGNNNARLIPACISIGGMYLLVVDNLARMLTGSEIPLGILTSLIGAPFFVYLLKSKKGGGW